MLIKIILYISSIKVRVATWVGNFIYFLNRKIILYTVFIQQSNYNY